MTTDLIKILKGIMPYAENELASLHETARRDGEDNQLTVEIIMAESSMDAARKAIAEFGDAKPNSVKEDSEDNDVILHLYHGRDDPKENLDNWGFDGPRIAIHCFGFTYQTLWIYRNGDREELKIVEGCIEWEGKYYGDFEIVSKERDDRVRERKKA